MSRDERHRAGRKADGEEDIRWIDNHERRRKPVETLKKRDLLNYFRNIQRECRREISSDEDDYRSSSNDSKLPRTPNKGATKEKLIEKSKRNSEYPQNSKKFAPSSHSESRCIRHTTKEKRSFEADSIGRSSGKYDESLKSNRASRSKELLCRRCEFSPKFYGRYSRKNVKNWPEVTEVTSLEIVKSRSHVSQRGHSEKIYQEKSKPVKDSITSVTSITSGPIEVTSKRSRNYKRDTNEFEISPRNQFPFDLVKDDLNSLEILCCEKLLKKEERENRSKFNTTKRNNIESRSKKQLVSPRSLSSPRSPRTKTNISFRPCDKIRRFAWKSPCNRESKFDPLRGRQAKHVDNDWQTNETSWEGRKNFHPLKTTTCPCYPEEEEQEKKKKGMKKNVSHGTGEKLCKLVNTQRGKEWLGCCCEKAEMEDRTECSKYCRCPEKENHYKDRIESCNTNFRQRDLSTGVSDPDHWSNYGERWKKVTNQYKRLTSTLNSARTPAEITGKEILPAGSRKRFARSYPSGKEFSSEMRRTAKETDHFSNQGFEESDCECKGLFRDSPFCQTNTRSTRHAKRPGFEATCCCSSLEDPVRKLESFCERIGAINREDLCKEEAVSSPIETDFKSSCCREENDPGTSIQELWKNERSSKKKWTNCVTVVKPEESRGKTNLRKILIYPPRGENGPPLTLYKNSSNIDCRVQGDVSSGFHYDVTYIQRFISPIWCPEKKVESRGKNECECSDYG